MTEAEERREQRKSWPSEQPREKRKQKLRMRYGKDRKVLEAEMTRTAEKFILLNDIWWEIA